MSHDLKKIVIAIRKHKFYHAFNPRDGSYVGSCQNERVADCYKIGGYRVIYLCGGN